MLANYYPSTSTARAETFDRQSGVTSQPSFDVKPNGVTVANDNRIRPSAANDNRVLGPWDPQFVRDAARATRAVAKLAKGRVPWGDLVYEILSTQISPQALIGWNNPSGYLLYTCAAKNGIVPDYASITIYNGGPAGGQHCLSGQAVVGAPSPLRVGYWENTTTYPNGSAQARYSHIRSYITATGFAGTLPTPIVRPLRRLRPEGKPLPAYNPQLEPIVGPSLRPFPQVYRGLRARPNTVYYQAGNVAPGTRPTPVPGNLPAPPPKGTKERKLVLAVGGKLARIIGEVSEVGDYIESFYNALPQALRTKLWLANGRRKLGAWAQAVAVYENFDQVNDWQLISNLIANEIEDRAYGKLGQITAKANRRRGAAGGLTLGPAL